MVDALQIQLVALREQIGATAFSDNSKNAANWCCGQLPALYTKLSQTNESRYHEEIRRLVQNVLRELTTNSSVCPEAAAMAESVMGCFQLFHEQFGLPGLELKMPSPSARHATRKVG